MRKMKKGLILLVCLMSVALMSACTFTVEVTPEDINTVGNLVKDYLVSWPGCESNPTNMDYCSTCGQYNCNYGYGDEGMPYREEPEATLGAGAVGEVGMANPIRECASLEEINAAAGTNLVRPGVMGVSGESFCTITGTDCVLADYDFTVAGYDCCFRAGSVFTYDISGVYINGAPAFSSEPRTGIEYAEGEGYKLARWFTIDGQYVFSVADHGEMEQATFASIAEELKDESDPAWSKKDYIAFYDSLEGVWQDEASQRAVMTVVADGSECVHITVEWANNYAESTRWIMTGRVAEDGQIYYTDCVCENLAYAEDGTATATPVFTQGEGYLALNPEDGKLYWSGVSESGLAETPFVRVPTDEETDWVGYWYDLTSERAVMSIEAIPGSENMKLQVNWGSGASENTCWTMTATFDAATSRLTYSDCEKSDIVLHENAPEDTTVVYSGGTGYFTLNEEGYLLWDGAAEEDCRSCKFALAMG